MIDGSIDGLAHVIREISQRLPDHMDRTQCKSLEATMHFNDDERDDIQYEIRIAALVSEVEDEDC